MRFLYTLTIRIYYLAILFASLFNKKAKQWIKGRKTQRFPELNKTDKPLWFHAASLGEFEQGRPVIEAIKKKSPEKKILLTFFSPSGYEVRKNYEYADFVYYLPSDTPSNVSRFLDAFNPSAAIFIKYEYWYNFMNGLRKQNTPYYYISAIYRPEQIFFKPYGSWFRNHLKNAAHIFCQDKNSEKLLKSIGLNNITLAGDTRFDRVKQVTSNPMKIKIVDKFTNNKKTILAGSSWPQGEKIIKEFLLTHDKNINLIIAPHLIDTQHIEEIEKLFSDFKTAKFSELTDNSDISDIRVLIIDGIGFLMHLYQYCDLAYIGGGFGEGIHNIVEAAAFGKPVIFGPNYKKFKEAVDLITLGGAFTIDSADDFKKIADKLINDKKFYMKSSETAFEYVKNNTGATDIILNSISL